MQILMLRMSEVCVTPTGLGCWDKAFITSTAGARDSASGGRRSCSCMDYGRTLREGTPGMCLSVHSSLAVGGFPPPETEYKAAKNLSFKNV